MDTNFWEVFELNSTEHKHVRIVSPRFYVNTNHDMVSWKEAKNGQGCDAPRIEKIHK